MVRSGSNLLAIRLVRQTSLDSRSQTLKNLLKQFRCKKIMVTVVANNRIRRSSTIAKGVASTNIASTRKSLMPIRHPQTLIVITVGIAVLVLYSLEHSLVYESTHMDIRLARPLRPWVQTSSFADGAPPQIPAARRREQSSTSRFGMIPKKYLRTSILRPLDTLDAKTDTSEARRSIQQYRDTPPEGAIQNDALHSSEDETVDDNDDNQDVTATPDTFTFPRVMNLYEWNQNLQLTLLSTNIPLTTPLPLDPYPVHFDIQTNNNLANNKTTTYEQEIFPFEREFFEDCEPIKTPQVHPTCNHLHEQTMQDDQTSLLSTKGSWRTAWTVRNDTAVLKVLQYSRSFDHGSYERHAMDVIVSDLLTASPYVIDAFGFCGQSILQEWAPSGARDVVKSYDIRNRQRLKIARDLARGLADLQALQAIPHESFKDGGRLTLRDIPSPPQILFSHNDINIANTIYSDSRKVIKWNDFNIGVFLRTKKGSNFTSECGAPVKFRADLWRSPEEVRNTSYVQLPYTDMYGFGNILYQVMTRHQPWTHKEPEGQLTVEQVADRKRKGILPTMPEKYLNATSKDLQIMLLATRSCYHPVPSKRLTAYELAHALSYLYDRLQNKQPVTSSMLRDFFMRK